jgi:hypothetical protein
VSGSPSHHFIQENREMMMRRPLVLASLACFASMTSPLFASHNRGTDDWVAIDINGVVTVTATTRWDKGAPLGGVDADRFGFDFFGCPANGTFVTLVPATGMRILRVPDAAVMYEWPASSFSLSATTVAVDTSNPDYDQRTQELVIPLGSFTPPPSPNVVAPPLLLPTGDYDLVWNDWARADGIQNLPPNPNCDSLDSGFGFRLRIHYDGTPHHGPQLGPSSNAAIVRGLDYSLSLNAIDADFDLLTYALVPTNPQSPDFGPLTQIPGLSVTPAGEVKIPGASTTGLLENAQGVPGADYLLRVRVADSTGMISEIDRLLDVVRGPAELTGDLIQSVQSLPVAKNVKKTLNNKLQVLLDAIDAQDLAAACEDLQKFIDQVVAYTNNKKLTRPQAAELLNQANAIGALLGC